MNSGHVLTICNALVDILVEVDEAEFQGLNIERGVMHLVDHERQSRLIDRFRHHPLTYELGGSGMNTTRALAALGMDAVFFGSVGDDEFSRKIQSRMDELGIKSRITTTEHPTGSCAILITPDGERTMNTFLGASLYYHQESLPVGDIMNARLLHVTGYQWSTDHQRYAVKQALEIAKAHGTIVSFDVADPFVVRSFRDDFLHTIEEYADIVFANAQEASDLFQSQTEDAAATIVETGAIAVLKQGAKGAMVRDGSHSFRIAPVATQVVDTTAAGDMFAAGFLYGYLNGRPHDVSGQMAALLASDVISRVGAVLSPEAIAKVNAL
jgi:sugar/nucleoside kinase (ribokinase family)